MTQSETNNNGVSSNGTEHEEFCHRCSRNYQESELTPITTVVNGIEQKERVCGSCEPEAREDEKPRTQEPGTKQLEEKQDT